MRDRFLRHDATIHVLAALLTLVLWSYVKTADLAPRPETSQTWTDVPLEVRDIPADVFLVNELPSTVTVVLRGNPSALDQVLRENLLAYVSLSGAKEGVGHYAVKVMHPQGLAATVTPPRVEVRLEKELRRDFDIQVSGLEQDELGQHVQATISPQSVRITGLRSKIEQISQVVVTVGSAIKDGKMQLPIKALDANGEEIAGLTLEPSLAQVTINRWPGKKLPVIPEWKGQLPEGYHIETSQAEPAEVYVYAPANVLASLQGVHTEPIDIASLTEDTNVTVKLQMPQGVVASSMEQVQLKIKVRR